MAAALSALFLACSLACSVTTGELPRPGSCAAFAVTMVSPAEGDANVATNVLPVVTFNDYPNPDTFGNTAFLLWTGVFYYTTRAKIDLIDRTARFEPSGGLLPGIGYTMTLDPKVQSLQGCLLQPPPAYDDGTVPDKYAYHFITRPPNVESPPRPGPATSPPFSMVLDAFAASCAGAGCHLAQAGAADNADCLDTPAGDLSLCARDAHDALVGVGAREVDRMTRVLPRDSSRSFLLRKLLGAPPRAGHTGAAGQDLPATALRTIADWIEGGAPAQ